MFAKEMYLTRNIRSSLNIKINVSSLPFLIVICRRLLPTLSNSTVPAPGLEFCAYRQAATFPDSNFTCLDMPFTPAGPTVSVYNKIAALITLPIVYIQAEI